MKGKVLIFDETTLSGKISGFDGNRYSFVRQEWQSDTPPKNGTEVDFEISEGNFAKEILVVKNSSSGTGKSRVVYVLLGLFFGCFGIHNFYATRTKFAVIQLIITVVLGWLIIGVVITGIWALAEVITVTEDGEGNKFA